MNSKNERAGKNIVLNLISKEIIEKSGDFDHRSYMGQFGWTQINDIYVPYIFRFESTKVISLRIVCEKIFPRFFTAFKQELFDLFSLNIFTMTDHETKLYNEINSIHCDNEYGFAFQKGEQLVDFNEVLRMNDFLSFVYNTFVLKQNGFHVNFGYMRFEFVNRTIPFYKIADERHFPTAYFIGNGEFQEYSVQIDSFPESVLRFLMKLQNVVILDDLQVVSFEYVKKFLHPKINYAEKLIHEVCSSTMEYLRTNED